MMTAEILYVFQYVLVLHHISYILIKIIRPQNHFCHHIAFTMTHIHSKYL